MCAWYYSIFTMSEQESPERETRIIRSNAVVFLSGIILGSLLIFGVEEFSYYKEYREAKKAVHAAYPGSENLIIDVGANVVSFTNRDLGRDAIEFCVTNYDQGPTTFSEVVLTQVECAPLGSADLPPAVNA
jgi:hypothetical protein